MPKSSGAEAIADPLLAPLTKDELAELVILLRINLRLPRHEMPPGTDTRALACWLVESEIIGRWAQLLLELVRGKYGQGPYERLLVARFVHERRDVLVGSNFTAVLNASNATLMYARMAEAAVRAVEDNIPGLRYKLWDQTLGDSRIWDARAILAHSFPPGVDTKPLFALAREIISMASGAN